MRLQEEIIWVQKYFSKIKICWLCGLARPALDSRELWVEISSMPWIFR